MRTVKDLMVLANQCASVHQDISVREAVRILKCTENRQGPCRVPFEHGALLVLDEDNRFVGKLCRTDIVMKVDPACRARERPEAIAHTSTAGLSPALLRSLMEGHSLWSETFEQRCQKVLDLTVADCMCTPGSSEYVLETDLLDLAIHRLVIGSHQSLLVTGGEVIVGILSLTDVFEGLAWTGELEI